MVSQRLAERLVEAMPPLVRQRAQLLSLDWMTLRHEGADDRLGITGRPYTWRERPILARNVSQLVSSRCPFADGDKCSIGGLSMRKHQGAVSRWVPGRWRDLPYDSNRERAAGAPYSWLPFLILRILDQEMVRELVRNKLIADCKVALMTRHRALDFEEQWLATNLIPETVERHRWELAHA